MEIYPTSLSAGEPIMIRVAIENEAGIDDWYCVPKLDGRLRNELRFGDFWTRGFERPKTVNRFYQRELAEAGEYDFFVTAWDAQRTPRESNHIKVKVVAAGNRK